MVYTRMYSDDLNRIMLARITPGSSIGIHTHETNSEIVYVLSGTARIMMDDGEEIVHAGTAGEATIARRDIGMRPTVRGMRIWWFTPSSRSMGRANKKAAPTHKQGKATKPGSPKGSRDNVPCRVQGQRPCWGLGQRPNCFSGAQLKGNSQQRRRQRSVPASNSARPQTRPQAALPQNFVKNHKKAA